MNNYLQVSTIRHDGGSYGGSKSNLSASRRQSWTNRNSRDLTPFIEEPLTPEHDLGILGEIGLPSTVRAFVLIDDTDIAG